MVKVKNDNALNSVISNMNNLKHGILNTVQDRLELLVNTMKHWHIT